LRLSSLVTHTIPLGVDIYLDPATQTFVAYWQGERLSDETPSEIKNITYGETYRLKGRVSPQCDETTKAYKVS